MYLSRYYFILYLIVKSVICWLSVLGGYHNFWTFVIGMPTVRNFDDGRPEIKLPTEENLMTSVGNFYVFIMLAVLPNCVRFFYDCLFIMRCASLLIGTNCRWLEAWWYDPYRPSVLRSPMTYRWSCWRCCCYRLWSFPPESAPPCSNPHSLPSIPLVKDRFVSLMPSCRYDNVKSVYLYLRNCRCYKNHWK